MITSRRLQDTRNVSHPVRLDKLPVSPLMLLVSQSGSKQSTSPRMRQSFATKMDNTLAVQADSGRAIARGPAGGRRLRLCASNDAKVQTAVEPRAAHAQNKVRYQRARWGGYVLLHRAEPSARDAARTARRPHDRHAGACARSSLASAKQAAHKKKPAYSTLHPLLPTFLPGAPLHLTFLPGAFTHCSC